MKTYGNPPKTLVAFAKLHADKIEEVGSETGTEDGYWLYLNTGWCWDDQGLHSVHEYTVQDCISVFPRVKACNCHDCRQEKELAAYRATQSNQ